LRRLKDINWNHLYCFYEVARAQSLKGGAEQLHLASSTLSEQLRKLEEAFTRKLFIRSSRGLDLTQDGRQLYEHAQIMFEEGSRVLEKFSEDDIGGYPVSVGIEQTISYELASELASQYWDEYASFGTVNTVNQVDHDTLIENLLENHIDWGITLTKPTRKSINYAMIGSFEIVFCCSTQLYKKFREGRDILVNIPFAEYSWDKTLNLLINKHLRSMDISPREKLYSDHPDFIKSLCDRGRCVMYMVKNPLKKYPGLKIFELEDSPIRISLYAVWNKRDQELISIKKLRDLIGSKFSQLPDRYEDIDLQIEASDISEKVLK
jgi:DNA-binding transcriptional LysR family regulator